MGYKFNPFIGKLDYYEPSGTYGESVHPNPSTDNAVARYDGVTGDLQNSSVLIDDDGNITLPDAKTIGVSGGLSLQFDNTNEVLKQTGGGLWIDGTIGATPTSGAGTRLMWIPEKGALRAGEVQGTEWDDANIGDVSFAAGKDVTCAATISFVQGDGPTITSGAGGANFAQGYGNIEITSGGGNFAQGRSTGQEFTSSGQGSFAQGSCFNQGRMKSTGQGSFTQGVSFGMMEAIEDGAFTQGSTSLGGEMSSSGNGSFVQGYSLGGINGIGRIEANNNGAFAQGYIEAFSFSPNTSKILASGQGSFAQGRVNALTAVKNIEAAGDGSMAHGFANAGSIIASGENSLAIGDDITASATLSMAFGTGFTNATASSFMVGFTATPALQVNATGVGVGMLCHLQ
jgi:hypothetical protein